jgi:chorismate mutase/prephenate dehydratase
MFDPKEALAKLRGEIDEIDQQIQLLINRRAVCAQQVADVKLAEVQALSSKTRPGLEADAIDPDGDNSEQAQLEKVLFYRPEREAQVLRRVMERNSGPLDDQAVGHIFREIMSACLALEKPMQVAYLGPEGTFTQAAAIKHFGHAVICRSQATIPSVFSQVESGQANYGVVPVENSTEGMVTHTLDNFIQSPLKICGEVELPIHIHLLIGKDSEAGKISKICAHQQALAQCRSWLDRNWPNVERVPVSSNGEAARMASLSQDVAAVAGDMAVDLYGLVKLAENIQDYSNNTTRFLIIGREQVSPSGDDKTSIIVSSHNKPGALFKLLEPFHREGIMLTRIDTRPSRTETWAYLFFIEFEGHQQNEKIKAILKELEEHSLLLKPLGSYPKAVL